MSDRVAVVTGSSRGIGRAIALRLAADGAKVVVNHHRDEDAGKEVVAAIEAGGGTATTERADVSDPAQLRTLFDAADRHYGGLDVFVHNAGGFVFGPLGQASDEDYRYAFDLNARATFEMLRESAARIRDNGRIVFVSSASARTAHPGSAVYAASKSAGEMLVRSFAKEIAVRGVTVNSVQPGPVDTEALGWMSAERLAEVKRQSPMGRLGRPDDVADLVGFLTSESARWVTGNSILVDGGRNN